MHTGATLPLVSCQQANNKTTRVRRKTSLSTSDLFVGESQSRILYMTIMPLIFALVASLMPAIFSASLNDCGQTPCPSIRMENETDQTLISAGRALREAEESAGFWPWNAGLKTKDGEFVCGGTLINSQIILTAAHCVDKENPDSFYVSLGDYDRLQPEIFQLDMKIRSIFIHPFFNISSYHYDLAIIILNDTVPFLEYPNIRPICLPGSDYLDDTIREGVVVGWGLRHRGGLRTGPLLRWEKMTSVNILPPDICSKLIGPFYHKETMICALEREGRICNWTEFLREGEEQGWQRFSGTLDIHGKSQQKINYRWKQMNENARDLRCILWQE
ncbi:unnamed protein product [Darwinula stevensoni]|uniref:Peptidase S1 domain-containing protein n=1 Tax=Darwinula stevensoni TaxID=69355 RepID=A0A7R8XCV3_9CRUS|nr:unnamed protein product [Darwinula stevensoni]CAG0892914.1 unnamed protein product [Darwinula stevensoni]